MPTDLIEYKHSPAPQVQSFFQMSPKEQVIHATEIATVLSDVIEKQKLYVNIQGKKYVKVEGWQTLGTFLGVIPREKSVHELDDGSFEAYVELVKFSDGLSISGASALCSIHEKRWGHAEAYARRSMAITRATGKAYRTGFAWIVTLAGYQPTPAEEMFEEKTQINIKSAHKSKTEIYIGTPEQASYLKEYLEKKKVAEDLWATVEMKLLKRPITDINEILFEVEKIIEGDL